MGRIGDWSRPAGAARGDADDATWAVRAFVFRFVVERGVPPTAAEAAAGLGIGVGAARAAYRRLGARHGVLLEPGGESIRMAKPFSGVPTPFPVRANGRVYHANCALDAFGIPAALQSDAELEAEFAEDGAPARLAVAGGRVRGDGGVV
ncbi:MAG: alkylmercury lyase family protein, partial [Chloroflexota bacterium]|nr:alkylmercury lyase family protein [Chloroflexota bacterium]